MTKIRSKDKSNIDDRRGQPIKITMPKPPPPRKTTAKKAGKGGQRSR